MMAYCGGGLETPAWPPGQVINDYTTGYYGALAIQATILRRMKEGGGYILSPSLTKTAMSIMKHFKSSRSSVLTSSTSPAIPPDDLEFQTGIGLLKTLNPLPVLSLTPIECNAMTLVPMGSSFPVFSSDEDKFDIPKTQHLIKKELLRSMQKHGTKRNKDLKEVTAQYNQSQKAIDVTVNCQLYKCQVTFCIFVFFVISATLRPNTLRTSE
jgi:hypothetical protein